MFFSTNFDTAREELEQLSKIIQDIKQLSDDEAEEISEEFYPFLAEISEIAESEFNFSYDETYSYFKLKLWLEMYKNTYIESCDSDALEVLRNRVKGRIEFLDDKGSVKDRDLFKECLEYIK